MFFRAQKSLPCKQSQQFLPLLLLFLYFLVCRFTRNSRLCQLLALCLKCRRPEAWTGFQTFFEYQHSNLCKKNDRPSLYERCLLITDCSLFIGSTGPVFQGTGQGLFLVLPSMGHKDFLCFYDTGHELFWVKNLSNYIL